MVIIICQWPKKIVKVSSRLSITCVLKVKQHYTCDYAMELNPVKHEYKYWTIIIEAFTLTVAFASIQIFTMEGNHFF